MTLASVTVHEARHIEVGRHVCATNDWRVDDLHAFGAQYYFLRYLAERTVETILPAEYRPHVAWSACAMRSSAFCADRCS